MSLALSVASTTLMAQSNKWRDIHTVKKKETIFSISRDYGLTIEELVKANPEMRADGYKLKKGSTVFIPFSSSNSAQISTKTDKRPTVVDDVRTRAIRLGVMLPLHDINGDGRRMIEYYRGVLMACDSLKKEGISVDVFTWNLAEDGNVATTLADRNAAQCDLIIGPLYSKFVPAMAQFVQQHGNLLVIPFSINAPEVGTNRNIFQIYQSQEQLNESTTRRFCEWFKDYHPIIIDCADSESSKGQFTSMLRKLMDQRGMNYSLTSLSSTDDSFLKAFSTKQKNVVVLNTARSPQLNSVFGKLSAVSVANPNIHISMFGYTEWLMYVNHQLENFYKYNVYIPSAFYTNLTSQATERLQQKYRWNFHQDMMQSLPRFALTGFDHALFFLRGLHKYGKAFDGAAGRFGYAPVQTPLKFERLGNGGLQNRSYMFVHYLPEHKVEIVNY